MARNAKTNGKQKLVSLHTNGVDLTPGMAEFVHDVLIAAATRSQDTEHINAGGPVLASNAAGDLVVYVSTYSV